MPYGILKTFIMEEFEIIWSAVAQTMHLYDQSVLITLVKKKKFRRSLFLKLSEVFL